MSDRHQYRADWHEYNEGVFFVTVCCAEKRHYLGEISDGKMVTSAIGDIVESHIRSIAQHFPDVEILNHVVMPNHVHLIIAAGCSAATRTQPTVATNRGCLKPRQHGPREVQNFHHNNRLSVIMRCLKGGIKREAGRRGIEFSWQSRFYDHIIRNRRSFENIMNYVDSNVENWETDRFSKDIIY